MRPGADIGTTWEQATARLRDDLARHGLPDVEVQRDSDPPEADRRSGTFQQILGALPSEPRASHDP